MEFLSSHEQTQTAIISALSHPSEGVRVAACTCIKSISRSVKVRRCFQCNTVFKLVFYISNLLSGTLSGDRIYVQVYLMNDLYFLFSNS